MTFEPWVKTAETPDELVTREAWQTKQAVIFMVGNSSYKLLFRIKAEMVADVGSWDEERGQLMMRSFTEAREFLRVALGVIEGAEARILIAGTAADAADARKAVHHERRSPRRRTDPPGPRVRPIGHRIRAA
jgi:hypothetical protein